MDQEQRCIKNASVFSVTIEKFKRAINGGIVEMALGTVCGFHWHAKIRKFSEDGVAYLSIIVVARELHRTWWRPKRWPTELAICVKNKSLERWEKCQGTFEVKKDEWMGWETFMRLDTVRNPNSGFLSMGALTLQFEIRIDFFINTSGHKMLNFMDPFEGSVRFQVDHTIFYVPTQMLILHSPVLAEQLAGGCDEVIREDVRLGSLNTFLQLIHGVKYRVPGYYILDVLFLAHKYRVLTVLRQMEVLIKNCTSEEIHSIAISPLFYKTLIGEDYDEYIQREDAAWDQLCIRKYEELNVWKRKTLLAITKKSYRKGDPREPFQPVPAASPLSTFGRLSKAVGRVTGCMKCTRRDVPT